MKNNVLIVYATMAMLAFTTRAFPAQDAKRPMYFQLTKSLAQVLVEEMPQKYPEVQCCLIHARLFDGINHAVIASYKLDQVGEVDEEEDNIVTEEENVIINPRINDKSLRWNVRLPVKDASGNMIKASWAIYMVRKPGDDMPKILAQAIAVRDDVAKRIPNLAALFAPPAQ